MNGSVPDRDRGPLLTLSRGLGILEVLSGAPEDGMTHARLAAILGFQRSTLYRYLASLQELGFVESIGDGRYLLGARATGLATAAARDRAFRRMARRAVDQMSALVGEPVHATVFSEGQSVTVAAARSSSRVAGQLAVGTRRPAHASASGRLFLALLPVEIVHPWLRSAEVRTTGEAGHAMGSRLDSVRECGFSTDEGEYWPGVSCLAIPVFDHSAQVVGSLSLALTGHKASSSRLLQQLDPLQRAGRSLSASLGHE